VNPAAMGPISTAADLRRLALAAACLAAVGVVALVAVGRPLMGLFLVVGFGLGLVNVLLLRRAASQFAAVDGAGKPRFALGALGRLAVITALALAIGVLVQPDGMGVFLGLAAFQLLLVGVALVPLLKELRQTGAER
jgi:hypothetical protein